MGEVELEGVGSEGVGLEEAVVAARVVEVERKVVAMAEVKKGGG